MPLTHEQLTTLVAIVDLGTFDAAANRLGVTRSAVSQRIRALESHVGQVVLIRSTPCQVTTAGSVLLRLARQYQLLESEALAELSPEHSSTLTLPVAVNADSLATWFVSVIEACASIGDATLQLHLEDEALSSGLLRAGVVLGAVTSDGAAVQGCSVIPLGSMRYLPVAAPWFLEKWADDPGLRCSDAPVVRFNAKDDLQMRVLGAGTVTPPTPMIPSAEGYLTAVEAGLGWGLVPETQASAGIASGRLTHIKELNHIDVPLYWQRWRIRSSHLDELTTTVQRASATSLRT